MRLVLVDSLFEERSNFFPLSLGRPLWELRAGTSSLADKLVAKIQPDDTGTDKVLPRHERIRIARVEKIDPRIGAPSDHVRFRRREGVAELKG